LKTVPGNTAVKYEAIDKCVGELTSAIQEAIVSYAPKHRDRTDRRPHVPISIQEETPLKTRLRRRWQVTRDPPLKAKVNRLTHRLNEWRNEQRSDTLESLDSEDQSLRKITKRVMRVPTPSPPIVVPGGLVLSDPEKTEALADSLEAQFQPVNDPSDPAVVEIIDEMRA
jgi:hypothetical protein